MKLVGIEFHGFKSFADSANLRFHDGITAIVGPNGCGKSNISDGLRWVLGEQRPTAIRGSRMEEAIFQGTQKRKPIQRAEVTLRLSNEDHVLPVPYSDVEISRTVFTGGDGEYRLNGTLCRLRDIQDLCRDTGLGSNAYSIIEGRMIDAILSDKAEERRAMFEEAAGIGRYKERRRVASRRLDEADADLARVDDLISEVQTKVRSLARQRGKARRYLEMRERKLALELALARSELTRLQHRHLEIDSDLRTLEEARVQDAAQLRSAEADHESLRMRLTDMERERADGARELMAVRDRLAERERQRLLADERARHSKARLEQLAAEKLELRNQEGTLQVEVERLQAQVSRERDELTALRERLKAREIELAELTERRQAMEAAEAAVESEQQAFREKKARLQAGQEAARAEAAELTRRIEEAERKHAAIAAALAEAAEQERVARQASRAATEHWRSASSALEAEREQLTAARAEREAMGGQYAALTERLQALSARIDALAPLTTGEEGLNPAVQSALAQAERLGIRGVLGREIEVPEAFADSVEAYLGAYIDGLLVDDESAVNRIRDWFLDEYDGPGGLVILPSSRIGPGSYHAVLPSGLRVSGIGAPWVLHLLQGVKLGGAAPESGNAWVGPRESVDALGVVRIGRPYAGGGALARKAELDRLQGQRGELEPEARGVAARVTDSERRVTALASRVEDLESARRAAAEEAERLAARAEASGEKLTSVREQLAAAEANMARLQEERSKVLERGAAEEEALRTLRPMGTEAAPRPEDLAEIRSEWESARERVTRLQLDEAKASGAFDRVERELQSQRELISAAAERTARLGQEEQQLGVDLRQAEEESESAARDLETLFEEQALLETRSREMEERVEDVRQKVTDLEATLRKVQQEERGHSDRRHELQLERTQIDAELHRTRERLEDEWGRPFDELVREVEPAEGEHDALREELTAVAERLGGIGLVNMLAEQEYQEEKERLDFLEGQREDLAKARDDLRETIRQINETASAAFLETFEKVRVNFKRTFQTLFEGGECDVWLEDPTDLLDSPVEISASPRGKRTQRIHLLSGGERALTALSLLFAIYLVKPSPFCVMDEVDAPLDETNILRFVSMLEEFKSDVQFIVITHNPVTIEAADWIYGVTMEEPGVSKIVGVEFSDYARGAVA